MKKILLLFIPLFLLLSLQVNADEIAVYGVQFNWCNEYTDYCSVNSNVLYGQNAKMTLQGPMNAVDYNQKKFDYLAGIRFWSEITGQTNDVVSLYYTLTLTGLQESETYANTAFNSKGFYYTSSNVTLLNAKLLSNTYVEDSNPTDIDGNPVFLGTQTVKFKVNVQLNQNFEDSSLYVGIGSFSNANGQSSIIVYQHIANVVTIFAENYYTIDNNSTIINQNDTMINQNQTIIDQNNKTNQELGDLNDSLNNSDTSDATNSAGDFFSGFQTDTFGLTSIITAPLTLIGNITSSSCSPVGLPLPYVDKTLNLPCLTSIYQQYFGPILTIYQTITFGIVAYWVCIRIFALVKDFKNPDHDEIEVLDL